MFYKASLDNTAKGLTIGIAVLFIVICITLPASLASQSKGIFFTPVFFVLIFLFVWLYHPIGYLVTGDSLQIKRVVNSLNIAKQDIQSIRILEKEEMRGTIRTFGVGGLFGYYGMFSNFSIGRIRMYATNRSNLVLIKTKDNKNYVVSPDDTGAFINEFANG